MRKNRLLVIALFLASLNLRPAINSVAPLLDSIRTSLGMSATVAGLFTSIPVLCMGVFPFFAIRASSKWGIERVIGWSLLLIGLGTVFRLFTHSTTLLLFTALLAGVGIAMAGPLFSGFIKEHFPKHVPSMVAIYTVAIYSGAALSTSFSVSLQKSFNSWQGALAFWAIIAFVAAIIWRLFVTPQVKKSTQTAVAKTKNNLPWKNARAWILTLSFGLMAMLFFSFTAWLPQIIQSMGYSKAYGATALTIFAAIQIPVSLVLPILLQKFPSRRLWLIIASLAELIGLILLVLNVQPLVASAFIGIGAGGLLPLNFLLSIDATANAKEAASWSAMTQSGGYAIGALGPIILGWVHDATNSFTTATTGMTFTIILMIIVQFMATTNKKQMGCKHGKTKLNSL